MTATSHVFNLIFLDEKSLIFGKLVTLYLSFSDFTIMTQVQLQQLQKQLWNIANTLRGTMGADEFRDYILGFIFYKYLSEKAIAFADDVLDGEDIKFLELDESNTEHTQYIVAIKQNSIEEVGYALTPKQLFHSLAERGRQGEFILDDL